MAFQVISLGASPNDGTGDPFRTGGLKINSNFMQAQADFNTHSLWINSLGLWQASMYNVFSTWVQSVFENAGGGGGGGGLTNGESTWLSQSINAAYTRLNNHSTWINSVHGVAVVNSTRIASIGVAVANQNDVFSTWIDSISAGGGGGGSSLREAVRGVMASPLVTSGVTTRVIPFGKQWQVVRSTNVATFWNPTTGLVEIDVQAYWVSSLTYAASGRISLGVRVNGLFVANEQFVVDSYGYTSTGLPAFTARVLYQYINTTGTDSIDFTIQAPASDGALDSANNRSYFQARVFGY